MHMDNFIAYNEALIDERDQGIAEIGQQIAEVHEIFQVRQLYVGVLMLLLSSGWC